MKTVAYLAQCLAETPESELRKVAEALWRNRFAMSQGGVREFGLAYRIQLHCLDRNDYLFLVVGADAQDDLTTITRVIDEVMNDAD